MSTVPFLLYLQYGNTTPPPHVVSRREHEFFYIVIYLLSRVYVFSKTHSMPIARVHYPISIYILYYPLVLAVLHLHR